MVQLICPPVSRWVQILIYKCCREVSHHASSGAPLHMRPGLGWVSAALHWLFNPRSDTLDSYFSLAWRIETLYIYIYPRSDSMGS